MAVSIVLATDDDALRAHVELVVDEAADLALVAVVSDLDRLAEALGAADPVVDVLLLDERMARVSLREAVRDASTANPFAGVVVLTPEASEASAGERYAAALEAGARSTTSFPSSLDDLRTRVQQAAEWGRSLRAHVGGGDRRAGGRGRLVAVSGAKGGVGTSVLACLLAREALESAPAVCLVDADLRGGTIGFYADVTARRTLADLADVASDLTGRSIREVAVDHECGLVLLLAPEEVERAEDLTADVARAVFSHLRSHFDVVVVDCGSDLDEARAMVLELADEVVLVTSPDVVALRSARAALATWERLAVRAAPTVRLVLNRVSKRVEVQPDLVSRVIGLPVTAAVPAAFAALEAPLNAGRLLHAPPAVLAPAITAISVATGITAPAEAPVRRRSRPPREALPRVEPAAGPGRGPRPPRRARRSAAPAPALPLLAGPGRTEGRVPSPASLRTPPPEPPAPPTPTPAAVVQQEDPWAPPPRVQRVVPAAALRQVGDPWAPPSPPAPVQPPAVGRPVAPDAPPAWNRVDGSGGLIARMGDPRGSSPRRSHPLAPHLGDPVDPVTDPGAGA